MLRILTLALLIALAGPATAQVTGAITPHPKLKELVVVSNDVVRIGDLVENAGSAAGIAVFRSPDLGYTGGVPLARVIEALAPYKLASLDTGSVTEVMVTRLSRAIPAKEIEARIARALAGQFGYGDASNISVTLDNGQRTIHVEPSAAEELPVTRLNVDPRTGRFTAVFELPSGVVARRMTLRVNGTAVETAETTILTRALNRGDVIKESDVITEKRPKVEIAGEFISAESAIGLAVKRPLRSGTLLRPSDLAKAEVIQRNESVTIVYEVPGVLLTVRGKALEAGAVGDLVGVLNMQSNRTVQAKVSGPGRVVISAAVPLNPPVPAPAAEPSNPVRPSAE